MADIRTLAERQAIGREARSRAKRSSNAEIGNTDRDPVALLEQNSAGRVEALVPLRYGRMSVSPFTFFRGSAILQAHDLAATANAGIAFPICGDAHLMNFGGFATPERQLVFDLNDFDEVAVGPWEWDVKRLAGSLAIAGEHMGIARDTVSDIVATAVHEYRDRMEEYAGYSALDLWNEIVSFERMLEAATSEEGRRTILKAKEKAAGRTNESMLNKMAAQRDGQWWIQDAPPAIFHPSGPTSLLGEHDQWSNTEAWRGKLARAFDGYLKTLPSERRALIDHFSLQDVAFKVVGVGSVGTFCLVLLMVDSHEQPLFLQVKEARDSVIALHYDAEGPAHQGQRVVSGQRLLQAASDAFLGWTSGPANRQFYFRQLRDMKVSADVERMSNGVLQGYARFCGWALARAHAKASGKAVEIAAYLGSGERFADAITEYSFACATQNLKDYEAFKLACRTGKIEARSDEDMAADFRM
ncbi:uncharacterized protein (DUF2252 family) [Cupriavidus metallidurans]|jgi:uncharacterized protein (DUF2252 family)|uniref:DUF2252 domain-containing protein n=1 Tax=Cupriavidus metallidurans (strain ATCC 43123 / DSM 2839 / NBRC 102507 / CH34) TaxID=266264 RepID=Q1LC64_CUPMC|nr:DUF2252 domain-containing protein [Cupriavidus metallidurans]ABF12262.1 conserved hypothetical protein [Cupriavidus metallidurans CH34]AVA35627.1 DUF2252 domain-containing protein [Cupriavidus metallidurans]KWW35451.1 hypothetical protein AU374_03518 [Cupriavidus metallidurans]MDE4921593.1 DUF2252 domain-containing protein [Cupriavidus metallidurans]QGS32489.1 DUF2252 domain-containing protein [Cupriavidus metallidurans]